MASLRILLASLLAALTLAAVPNAGAIVGGTPDPNRDFVVFVGQQFQTPDGVWRNGNACSGTLVAPKVVVTAAHCSLLPPGFPPFPIRYMVFQGDSVATATASSLGQFVPHPDFCFSGTCAGGPEGFTNNDVAVVLLDNALAGPYAELARPNSVERYFRSSPSALLVGFGRPLLTVRTSAMGAAHVDPTAESFLKFPGLTPPFACQGDSGGAVLDGMTLMAVISVGDTTCDARTFAYRVDTKSAHSFLKEYVIGFGGKDKGGG
jgi:hypothetical protein